MIFSKQYLWHIFHHCQTLILLYTIYRNVMGLRRFYRSTYRNRDTTRGRPPDCGQQSAGATFEDNTRQNIDKVAYTETQKYPVRASVK